MEETNMRNFAKHIIYMSNEVNGVTNLELQKIMYFSIGEYIVDNGIDEYIEELYDENLVAWKYGASVPRIYTRYRMHGSLVIKIPGEYFDFFKPMEKYVVKFLEKDLLEMLEDNRKRPHWQENRRKIAYGRREVIYTLEDITKDFDVSVDK